MNNQELVTQQSKSIAFPSQGEWQQILDIGTKAFRSGLLPVGIKTAEAAGIIALKAWELGLPPMMAFSHIHIINGKPTLSAELMQFLVRKNLPGIQITILENTEKKAAIRILRPEKGSAAVTYSFAIEDAERAKLMGKDVWKQYPKAMLFSRCISAALRAVCPDALFGVQYTPEELGAQINEGGDIVETSSRPIPSEAFKEEAEKPETPKIIAPVAELTNSQKIMRELNAMIVERDIPLEYIQTFTKSKFGVEKSLELSEDQLKETLEFCLNYQAPPAPWETEADPRIVK